MKIGIAVFCETCGLLKKPIGRDAPADSYYCTSDCRGYRDKPYPGQLWPGETDDQYGFDACDDATRVLTDDELKHYID